MPIFRSDTSKFSCSLPSSTRNFIITDQLKKKKSKNQLIEKNENEANGKLHLRGGTASIQLPLWDANYVGQEQKCENNAAAPFRHLLVVIGLEKKEF